MNISEEENNKKSKPNSHGYIYYERNDIKPYLIYQIKELIHMKGNLL